MSDFKKFAQQIHEQFKTISDGEMVRVATGDPLELWNLYLDSFPEGTNEIFRERRYYDGSYDRNVIRQIGGLVKITPEGRQSIWDVQGLDYPFNIVAEKLRTYVNSLPLDGFPEIPDATLGMVSSIERAAGKDDHVWHHFHANVPTHLRASASRTRVVAETKTSIEMFLHAHESLTENNVQTVVDLIRTNSIYRGQEFLKLVTGYQELRKKFTEDPEVTLYTVVPKHFSARIRNSVIGTLIEDLLTHDLENAVRRYEAKVAPQNYKRSTALITQGMIDNAVKTIESLGLESALERRYATLADVSVNDVLWVNNDAAEQMKGGIAGLLKPTAKVSAGGEGTTATSVSIKSFMDDVIPGATDIELMFEPRHTSKLVSITAPVHEDSKQLFKWDNRFAWAYVGDVADSYIAERVKSAGGNVDALLRVSLAWSNTDDLDLHCGFLGADGRTEKRIYFGNKAGILDVDANAGFEKTTEPVENMQFTKNTLKDGTYTFVVNQYRRRNNSDYGFTLEVASTLGVEQYSYNKIIRDSQSINCLKVIVKNGSVQQITVSDDLTGGALATEEWGISTNTFVKVASLMYSPNYWGDNATGNRHYLFMVDGCKNPDAVRGFYNEYLQTALNPHRKVFEVLGNKTMAPYADEQLSGLGFSSTRADSILVRVTTPTSKRLYKVNF